VRIGISRESLKGENRVAATPKTISGLLALGYEVMVEQGAGANADFPDTAYREAGAQVVDTDTAWASDIVLKVAPPSEAELASLRQGATLVALLSPRTDDDIVARCAAAGITALSMDMVPRISRAQSMDALSSMANISGYRAVIEAAHSFGRFLGGQVTAAGKVPPANVFVIGTGVAGLAAIGAAGSLGAVVRATDVRPETAEQVDSMGATFVQVAPGAADQGVSADGYAKETTDDYNARAALMYAEQAQRADIVVTTAAIPGRPSPKLITADMVAAMAPGSVIVDLAATGGGNCELTKPGLSYVTPNGVTIIGYIDMASRLPGQSSQLYATNLTNLVTLLTPSKDGELVLDFDDEIIRAVTITRNGEVTYPPPPVQVSAAPPPTDAVAAAPPPGTPKRGLADRPWQVQTALICVGALALIGLLSLTPMAFLAHMTVLVLAVVAGFYVVWDVTHALHTPLMSLTNAVSGIIVVGALLQLDTDSWPIRILAFIAVLVASINIFGGFAVTNRMLAMFRRGTTDEGRKA
jgi:NAD(P) transhydrogenase subunit alpha